ncbi:MAG: hypothetical protein KCHDKBKB_02668 [Elusimicrobia bacterium]|nr:hypothetical protein [Elusimicrobiota bacterium]
MNIKHLRRFFLLSIFLSLISSGKFIHATNLSIGADYLLRGVAITERDKTIKSNRYYDQRLQAYLTTDLSKDVEASVRIQSINPWGLEGSTTPLVTRYPHANGNVWVQHAYARLPHLWKDRMILTVGRQPIVWGDGKILSDDELGFNAIRAQIKSPWRGLPFDLEAFTAKINEGLTQPGDKDLHGAMLTFDSKSFKWDVMGLMEKSDGIQAYEMGASTVSVNSSKIERTIYGVRAITRLKDAYLKGEYYIQRGDVRREPAAKDLTLGGDAYVIGLGGKQNTTKFGRFGAILEYSVGSGDKASTPEKDEAFRPGFSSRWSGLERKGYGRYFAATFSDAYSPSQPFAPVTTSNDGLPAGISGIQSAHFGMESTPWSQWTFSLDYYQYKGQRNVSGEKELGTEFDYGFVYRYSGLINVRGSINVFNPGEAFDETTRQKAQASHIELELKF